MHEPSPRGLLYHLPPRKASRKPAALREAPPTAPPPFPIRRIPPPIVPEPARLPHAREELRDLVASFRAILAGAEDVPDYMLPDACATLRVYARSLAGELAIPHDVARGAK